MDDIRIITDKQELEADSSVELLPGIYQGNHWNDDSIYFSAEVFALVEPAFEDVLPDYNLHAFTEVETERLGDLIERLDGLRKFLAHTTEAAQLNGRVGFLHAGTEASFEEAFDANRQALEDLLVALTDWLGRQAEAENAITILVKS